jgi:guanylate kinase
VIEVVKPEERTKDSNKKMILESSKYCGNYYSKSQDKDADKSKYYFEIVLSIDPNDSEAKKALGIK